MSITNKLIANIKQTNIDVNQFTNTNNVICIDTCNNRIGINTKNPLYSIDICGVDGKVFVSNLEIGRSAIFNTISANTISANTISVFTISANTISGNICNFTNIDASLLIVKTINGSSLYSTSITGISGNIFDLSSNNINISNHLNVKTISADTIFSSVYDNFNSDVTFKSIKVGSIDCSLLDAININCDGLLRSLDLSCTNIIANTITSTTIKSDELQSSLGVAFFVRDQTGAFNLNVGLGTINRTFITEQINTANANRNPTFDAITVTGPCVLQGNCSVDNVLTVKKLEFLSSGALILPQATTIEPQVGKFARKTLGNNTINCLQFTNHDLSDSNIFTKTHYATIVAKLSTASTQLNKYKVIPIQFKTIKNLSTKTELFSISNNNSIDINIDLKNGIYEINASITLSYFNTISGDVEPNDYTFGLYDRLALTETNIEIMEPSYNYVKNRNIIFSIDTSYNYSSTSLHYIGPLYNWTPAQNTGFCYLITSPKDISNLNIEYFTSTIKLLNF